MEFSGIAAQHARIRRGVESRIAAVLDHGQFVRGPEVCELELALARFAGARTCVSCANGTDALQIALMALGVGRGDEVIVPAFSFFATVGAVMLAGATPVFADIDPASFNIDPEGARAAITSRTRCVIAVSLFGQCADLDAIGVMAQEHGVAVIEDAAQSFGAMLDGRRSGSLSRLACTSFFPSKPLGCYGDGGAILTDDAEIGEVVACIAQHGQRERYVHERLGMNSRLDTLQAAVLLEKLAVFEEEIARRCQVASWYREELEGTEIVLPQLAPRRTSVWAQFTIRVRDRDRVARELLAQSIPTAVHYPLPLHHQPACTLSVSMPRAEEASRSVLSLPMHPYLSREEVARVGAALRYAVR